MGGKRLRILPVVKGAALNLEMLTNNWWPGNPQSSRRLEFYCTQMSAHRDDVQLIITAIVTEECLLYEAQLEAYQMSGRTFSGLRYVVPVAEEISQAEKMVQLCYVATSLSLNRTKRSQGSVSGEPLP